MALENQGVGSDLSSSGLTVKVRVWSTVKLFPARVSSYIKKWFFRLSET